MVQDAMLKPPADETADPPETDETRKQRAEQAKAEFDAAALSLIKQAPERAGDISGKGEADDEMIDRFRGLFAARPFYRQIMRDLERKYIQSALVRVAGELVSSAGAAAEGATSAMISQAPRERLSAKREAEPVARDQAHEEFKAVARAVIASAPQGANLREWAGTPETIASFKQQYENRAFYATVMQETDEYETEDEVIRRYLNDAAYNRVTTLAARAVIASAPKSVIAQPDGPAFRKWASRKETRSAFKKQIKVSGYGVHDKDIPDLLAKMAGAASQ